MVSEIKPFCPGAVKRVNTNKNFFIETIKITRRMKKTIMLTAVAALMCMNAFAQQKACTDEQFEERVEKRAERIAERMGLDDKTEKKFASDYKKMMKERREVMQSHREVTGWCQFSANAQDTTKVNQNGKKQNNRQHLTDAEARKRLQGMMEVNQKNLDIVKDYSKKMGKYLSEKQVLQVMEPMLRQGNCWQRNDKKGMKQGCCQGKYQKGQKSRNYDCLVRRPRKK